MHRQLDEINEKRIQKLFSKFMVKTLWYQSILCSCISNNHGVRDPKCSCINGYYYREPVEYELIRTQPKNRMVNHQAGILVQGQARFSIPRYAINSKIKDDLPIYHQITKGDVLVVEEYTHTDTDMLMMDVRDEVWTFNIEAIWIVSQLDHVYREGKDYSYVDNRIIWHSTGNVPADETPYAVKFTAKQQYIVWDDAGMQRGVNDQHLGRVIDCKLRPYGTNAKNPIDTVNLKDRIFTTEEDPNAGSFDEDTYDDANYT